MGLAMVRSATVLGVEAALVRVEVDLRAKGLRQFTVVGLPEHAVTEGRVRVEAALRNSGYRRPKGRLTVNLAPAHLRKAGTAFDLPIALAILAAAEEPPHGLPAGLEGALVAGELALDGRVRPVRGCLPYALRARDLGLRTIVVPVDNAAEAGSVEGLRVVAVGHLSEAVEVLRGAEVARELRAPVGEPKGPSGPDLADVRGQQVARRSLEVAAAGGHNLLLVGPPGTGKTMLARRLPGLLPPMSLAEAQEATVIHSVKGLLESDAGLLAHRPFRAPHHTVSTAALIGGGSGVPVPGEVSLAHRGVLFLDVMPEFRRPALEALRQPLESRRVVLGRVQQTVSLPADFLLVGTMNPCPCGHHDGGTEDCRCTPAKVDSYRARVSGPLLDRVDLHVRVPPVPWADLSSTGSAESSEQVRARVADARLRQQRRNTTAGGPTPNGRLPAAAVRTHCSPDAEGTGLLRQAVEHGRLSARAHDRVLKVARTLADLDGEADVRAPHVLEALRYRLFEPSPGGSSQ